MFVCTCSMVLKKYKVKYPSMRVVVNSIIIGAALNNYCCIVKGVN